MKITAQSFSGSERLKHFTESIQYWIELPVALKLLGVGWGTFRPTNMFSYLLVNVGIFGMIFYCIFFLYPLFMLRKIPSTLYLRAGILSTFIILMFSVPEYSYLPPWFILGISYRLIINKKLNHVKKEKNLTNPSVSVLSVSKGKM